MTDLIAGAVAALDRPDLLAAPVLAALEQWKAGDVGAWRVVEIDGDLADTTAFCNHYEVPLERSANCVVVAGRRGEDVRFAACVMLANTRADVNGAVRRRLDARKASFAPMDDAVATTQMAYGGITPIGLPADWPVLIDSRVAGADQVVVGSGVRHSKLLVPGATLAGLPTASVLEDLAR